VKKPFDLNGKTAIVTGGGSGIGKAIAIALAGNGSKVTLFDLNDENGQQVVKEIESEGGEAAFIPCDVSNLKSVKSGFHHALNSKSLDILINNAGIAHVGNLGDTEPEDLDKIYSVNIKGVFHCMKEGIRHMKNGGAIVNMSSVAAHVSVENRFAYAMSKGAVHTMTLSVAKDYMHQNIRCNSIAPARIHTPFVDGYLSKNFPGKEKEMFEALSKTQPIGRMGQPDEVAALALYLCSDEATFITGTCFPIDGGFMKLNN
jgi:NAD(P)-dependent dehydrogenase (short-subunit alcohol dehydrogenase family)